MDLRSMDLARGRQIHGSGEVPSPKVRPVPPRSAAEFRDLPWRRDPSLVHATPLIHACDRLAEGPPGTVLRATGAPDPTPGAPPRRPHEAATEEPRATGRGPRLQAPGHEPPMPPLSISSHTKRPSLLNF
ncbi:unnamed protein product [Prorocentrum cordatum]|uniref:Uncharacterized protein n=1 Tax=Prorocentrum cordatum TaxID=2364126 RepID=A0ABN9XPN1_9DINO|nr:unnamed protein product [Polarella glacialis]